MSNPAATNTISVLLTGGGAPGAAGIIKCLKQNPAIKITTCDVREQVSGKQLAHDFFVCPAAHSPDFVTFILDKCINYGIHIIIPIVTAELIHFSKNKALFNAKGITVLVQEEEVLKTANDKGNLYTKLKESGIEVPLFFLVNDIQEYKNASIELMKHQNNYIFKPRIANGSRGFRIVSKDFDRSKMLFHEKPNHTCLRLDDALSILGETPFPPLLLSEFLPGPEYSVDVLARYGEMLLAIPRRRDKMNNGISTEGLIENNTKIIAYCKDITRKLNLNGNFGIQVKLSKENKFLILEINPRLQGTVSACLGANVNMPLLGLILETTNTFVMPNIKWNIRFNRFWEEVYESC